MRLEMRYFWVFLFVLGGCGSETEKGSGTSGPAGGGACVTGMQVTCSCPGNTNGVQACNANGTYDPCQCGGAGSGGSSGTGGPSSGGGGPGSGGGGPGSGGGTGSGGSGSGGSTSTGGSSCDMGDCSGCMKSACAAAACKAENDACQASVDCKNLDQCTSACALTDFMCLEKCEMMYPFGHTLWDNLRKCKQCKMETCSKDCQNFCM